MLHHAQSTIGDRHIVVTAQVVVSQHEAIIVGRGDGSLYTGHPGVKLGRTLVYGVNHPTILFISRGFERRKLGMILQIGTVHPLILCGGWIVSTTLLSRLHTDIHEQQRNSQRHPGQVVMIPYRLHVFVKLVTVLIVGIFVDMRGILVIGQDGMQLVPVPLVAHTQHIV